jgi:uncharacterized protein YceK
MKAAHVATVAALCAALASGCGTICNVASGNADRPYGGVAFDLAVLSSKRETPLVSNDGGNNGGGILFLFAFAGGELALSFVGDTLLLPLAIYLEHKDYHPVDGSFDVAPPASQQSGGAPSPEKAE